MKSAGADAEARSPGSAAGSEPDGSCRRRLRTPPLRQPARLRLPSEAEWTLDTGALSRRLFEPRRGGEELDSAEFQRQRRQASGTGQSEGRAKRSGFPFSATISAAQQPSTDLNKALWVAHPGGRRTVDRIRVFRRQDRREEDLRLPARRLHGAVFRRSDAGRRGPSAPGPVARRLRRHGRATTPPAIRQPSTTISKRRSWSAKPPNPPRTGRSTPMARSPSPASKISTSPPRFCRRRTRRCRPPRSTIWCHRPSMHSEQPYPGVAVGGEARNQLGLYVGPKELNALRKVNPKLEDIIDWGWFGIIAKPLFLVLQWMNDQLRPQLRLGDHSAHRHHQHRAVPAEAGQSEVDAQDAGAAAGDGEASTRSTRASA